MGGSPSWSPIAAVAMSVAIIALVAAVLAEHAPLDLGRGGRRVRHPRPSLSRRPVVARRWSPSSPRWTSPSSSPAPQLEPASCGGEAMVAELARWTSARTPRSTTRSRRRPGTRWCTRSRPAPSSAWCARWAAALASRRTTCSRPCSRTRSAAVGVWATSTRPARWAARRARRRRWRPARGARPRARVGAHDLYLELAVDLTV